MKKNILVLITFLPVFMFSQLVESITAEAAGLKDSPVLNNFSNIDNGIYYYGTKVIDKQEISTIEKYNDDLTKQYSFEFNIEKDEYPKDSREIQTLVHTTYVSDYKREDRLRYVREIQGRVYIFTTYFDDENINFYLRVLDDKTGKLLVDKTVLSKLKSIRSERDHNRYFIPTFSEDGSKLLIVSEFQCPFKPQICQGDIYDLPSLKLVKSFTFPDTYKNVLIKSCNYKLTNEGNVIYFFRNEVKDKEIQETLTLALYDSKLNSTKYKDVLLQNKITENLNLYYKNGMYYYAGIFTDDFSKKEKENAKTGILSLSVDPNDFNKTTTKFDYFSEEIESKYASYKYINKYPSNRKEHSEKGLAANDFCFLKSVEISDGFYFINNMGGSYRKGDYIVTKFNSTGKLEFIRLVPKQGNSQMFYEDIVVDNNNLYFFYCEHPKNLENYTLENFDPLKYNAIGNAGGAVPVCVKIDPTGKMERQILERNEKWCYIPGYGVFVRSKNQIVIMKSYGKEHRLEAFKFLK